MKSAFVIPWKTTFSNSRSRILRLAVPLAAGLLVFSTLVHLAAVIPFLNHTIALDDMFQYDMLARSLSQGEGFRWYARADVEILWPYLAQFLQVKPADFPVNGLLTTFRSPGYPFFLAGLYRLVRDADHFRLVRLAQALLFGGLSPLVYLLARRMRLGCSPAVVAGLSMALYPLLLFYPAGLASENIFIPLVTLSFLVLAGAARRPSLPRLVPAGLLLGFAMLARSVLALFVLMAAGWLVILTWQGLRGKPILARALRSLGSGVVLFTCAMAVCLPWAVRNSLILGKPAFIENSLGYNLFVGWHPDGNGEFISAIAILPLNILDDGERDAYCMQAAMRFIKADPLEALRRIPLRAAALFGPEDREFAYLYSNGLLGAIPQPGPELLYLLLVLPWFGTLFFAIPGLWLAPHRPLAWLTGLFIAGYAGVHLLILAEPRFHLALVPVLLPFAAYGWQQRRAFFARICASHPTPQAWIVRLVILLIALLWLSVFLNRIDLLLALLGPEGYKLALAY